MRGTTGRRAAILAVAGALVVSVVSLTPASGAPRAPGASPPVRGPLGGSGTTLDADNRGAPAAPSSHQVDVAERTTTRIEWNAYGTPSALTPVPSASPSVASADPVAVARGYLSRNRDLFGLSAGIVESLEVLSATPVGQGTIVRMRQTFGDIPSGFDGMVSLGVRGGEVVYATSSLSKASGAPERATLGPDQAFATAVTDAGLTAAAVGTSRVTATAVPIPSGGVRPAYQVVLIGTDRSDPVGVTTYVDAGTGAVLVREDLVDRETDNPMWKTFPANPPADYSSTDTRQTWCADDAPGCARLVADASSGLSWDVDPTTGEPTFTATGDSERATEKWNSNDIGVVGTHTATPSPTRDYTYAWTNQWHDAGCDPAVFTDPRRNDIDAALTNLFVTHNRMHDWSFHLGFTEANGNLQAVNGSGLGRGGDPELGNAQAGAIVGGAPGFESRNNANQITPPDGIPPITNMYLWQSQAGRFYAPCVDGDFDATIIGHEYAHTISERMVAGPDQGWSGFQAQSMNEADSDLMAMEYLYEYGFRPAGDTPFVQGGYVTGDPVSGIRNYDMSDSPLNYSDIGFEIIGPELHADGEIWVATNFSVRQAFIDRYGQGTPALQRSCADGATPVEACPGNRRWIQLLLDSFLLTSSGEVSMVDMRNAMLAADLLRFGGANQDIMWNAFASRGLGEGASSDGPDDVNPIPSFRSFQHADNATVRLQPAGQAFGHAIRLYVGDLEARVLPVADTDERTALSDTFDLAPGTYHFLAVGDGFGSTRFTRTVSPGQTVPLSVSMRRNIASTHSGASVSGDGANLNQIADDTETTNWVSSGGPVNGREVTIDLAGGAPRFVTGLRVSAELRPPDPGDVDPGFQIPFTALRQFQVLACTSTVLRDCSDDSAYRVVFTSRNDAFPSRRPRPKVPDMIGRDFTLPGVFATHLRLRVLTNQCTGGPDFAGDQDNDPNNNSDCATGDPDSAQTVRIAEFEAFEL